MSLPLLLLQFMGAGLIWRWIEPLPALSCVPNGQVECGTARVGQCWGMRGCDAGCLLLELKSTTWCRGRTSPVGWSAALLKSSSSWVLLDFLSMCSLSNLGNISTAWCSVCESSLPLWSHHYLQLGLLPWESVKRGLFTWDRLSLPFWINPLDLSRSSFRG